MSNIKDISNNNVLSVSYNTNQVSSNYYSDKRDSTSMTNENSNSKKHKISDSVCQVSFGI